MIIKRSPLGGLILGGIMAKINKTNGMRLLETNKIPYQTYEYLVEEGKTDGLTVANTIGKDPQYVYKTLVTQGNTKNYFVFVIPVGEELDLKKAAKVANQKHIEMIPMKDLLPITGYIHGGCSPLGMKKAFKTFFHETVLIQETIIFSGGRRGLQIEVNPEAVIKLLDAEVCQLILE